MKWKDLSLVGMYMGILILILAGAAVSSRVVTVVSQQAVKDDRVQIVVDAGHGGVDGGATSCTGVLESNLNLEIALRLDDLLHLLGYDTVMIRTTDKSVYTNGNTIAEKKISDLRERVRITNTTENALLVSIHQNYFSDGQYHGAQVFYAPVDSSRDLAVKLQTAMVSHLNPGSRRLAKQAQGVYFLQHITCPGILVECGFLSNPAEEAQLRDPEYQRKLCAVIATVCGSFLANRNTPL